jgi:predicted metal-dependent peptidase
MQPKPKLTAEQKAALTTQSKAKLEQAFRSIFTHHEFYGPCLMAMPWVPDFSVPTACTNGERVRYNPEFLMGLTPMQRIGLVIHEHLHPMLDHLLRMKSQFIADGSRTNRAADYEINNMVTAYNKQAPMPIILPPDGCVDVPKYGALAAEVIYRLLGEEEQPPPPPDEPEDEDEDGEDGEDGEDREDGEDGRGGGGGEDGEDGEDGRGGGEPSDQPAEGEGSGGSGGGEDKGKGKPQPKPQPTCGEFELPADEESLRETSDKWKEILNSCIQTAKLRGNASGEFLERLQELAKPPMDLRDLLARYVSELSISDDSTRMDRAYMANHDMFVVGMEELRHGTLVFVKDTSGSITSRILESCCAIVQEAASTLKFNRLVVIDADAAVCRVEEFGPHDTIPLTCYGRGGTDFRPALKYVDERIEDARVVVYLTDGYGEFPESPPNCPVLWITYGLSGQSYPFGEAVDLTDLVNQTV